MERYEANEWESYVAGVEIDAFGQQCAEEIMVAEVGIWLRDFKAGKITQPEYHNNLKKSGLENWSEEELKDFSVYKLSNMRERLREEDSESWQKYCCRGEKYMRTTIKGLEKLQNEIYDYALKIGILKDSALISGSEYESKIILARIIRRYTIYAEEEFSTFATNLGLDAACMTEIIKIFKHLDFCAYGRDFLMDKIGKNRYYCESHTVRITIVATAIAELIWQVSLKDVNIESYLAGILKEENKEKEDREIIIELTKELLAEHIKRMEETLDNGLYPVPVMLQILGYPDYDLEEYRLHIATIDSLVDKL